MLNENILGSSNPGQPRQRLNKPKNPTQPKMGVNPPSRDIRFKFDKDSTKDFGGMVIDRTFYNGNMLKNRKNGM